MAEVTLEVYDLTTKFAGPNSVLKSVVGSGVYHCGVTINDIEWSFGSGQGGGTGVFRGRPRQNRSHSFKQSVPMGTTDLSPQEVIAVIEELKPQWLASEYHVVKHNCCHFSNELCKRLGVGPVPGWVMSAAGAGERLDDAVHFRAITEAVEKGKLSRGVSTEDDYKFGDFCRGKLQGAREVVAEGSRSRTDSGENPDYRFGDATRGVCIRVKQGFTNLASEGKKARDASPSAGYRPFDLFRGYMASFAKR